MYFLMLNAFIKALCFRRFIPHYPISDQAELVSILPSIKKRNHVILQSNKGRWIWFVFESGPFFPSKIHRQEMPIPRLQSQFNSSVHQLHSHGMLWKIPLVGHGCVTYHFSRIPAEIRLHAYSHCANVRTQLELYLTANHSFYYAQNFTHTDCLACCSVLLFDQLKHSRSTFATVWTLSSVAISGMFVEQVK